LNAQAGRHRGPRVAYLLKRFPRLSETFVLNEMLELRRQGVHLTVYALMDPGETTVQPEAQALRPEVIYLHSPGRGVRSWLRIAPGAARQAAAHPLGAARVAWALASVHRSRVSLGHAVEGLWLARDLGRRRIDHLHAHFAHSPAAVAHFARLAGGPPFSFTAHAKDLYTTLPRNVRIRARAAEFVVTCTAYNGRYLEELLGPGPPAQVHVAHHGVELSRFAPVDRLPAKGLVLSVARLVPKKGLGVLMNAAGLLREQGVSFSLEVYGGGPQRDELQELASKLGVRDAVRLHGARVQSEIVDAYRRASVFALVPVVTDNGDRDGIPNVLIEAMASGVPVVSSSISGIPELITDGVEGFLVPPGDPVALASALKRLLNDPELARRMGDAGRSTVKRAFGLRESVASLRRLFGTGQAGEGVRESDLAVKSA
jgi:glycosyltransferase involved in cell wall biosynthesis